MKNQKTEHKKVNRAVDMNAIDLPFPNPFFTLLPRLSTLFPMLKKSKNVGTNKNLLITVLLSALLATAVSTSWAQTLILHKEVSVKGDDLKVGQLLAKARGLDPKFLKMRIGETPSIGKKRKWSRSMVLKFLKQHYHGTITWDGPKECLVTRPGRWIEESTVLVMIEKSLQKLTRGEGKAQVEELKSFTSFAVPVGPSDIIINLPSTTLSKPWSVATIHFEEDGERVLTKNIHFRWSWVRPAWRAIDSQRSGHTLDYSQFERISIDVLKESKDLYLKELFPNDVQFTRSISPGTLLTRSQFRPRVLIRQGDPVVVHYREGGVKIAISAIAMRDGARNEIIPARNNKSRKLLSVRVLDERNVIYAN